MGYSKGNRKLRDEVLIFLRVVDLDVVLSFLFVVVDRLVVLFVH